MKKVISMIIALTLTVGFILPANIAVVQATGNDLKSLNDEGNQISIMFTHDMHSNLESKNMIIDGKNQDVGGFARIKTVKDQIEKVYPGTFLMDAGDFSMGTAFQTIYRKKASELVTMGKIGYDSATLGNHEFDYNAEGVADMLNAAVKEADTREDLPEVTGLNIDWKKTLNDKNTKEAGQKLKAAFDNYGVQDYSIIEKNGMKIAVFGVMGNDAISTLPEVKIHFSDYIARAQQVVDEIKKNGEADMIVCLSHSGTGQEDQNFEDSDDAKLAKEVKGIDLIVSGHSHSILEKPKTVGGTVVVSCGEYNQNVGHIIFQKLENGKYKVKNYKLIPLDENVDKNSEIQAMINRYKSHIDKEYFDDYGYSYDEVLAKNNINFTPIVNFGEEQKEDTLANLIADSYIDTVNKMEKGKKNVKPAEIAVIPAGSVRDSFTKGEITVADAFNVSSLGVGADGSVGYPMVSIYLTGKELKNMAEVDASISPKMNIARLYTSGLGYTINKYRMPLNKASDVMLVDKNGKEAKLENKTLYRVVGGLYSCQRLSLVSEQSHGLLSIKPKDSEGNIIEDFNKAIIKDENGKELKEWYALATYIDSFKDGKVPQYYENEHNRKIIDDSLNPIKMFKNPNHIAIMVYAIALIPIVIIVGIVTALIKNKHRRRGYSKSIFSGSKNKNYTRVMSSRSRGVRPAKHKMNMTDRSRRTRKKRF